MKQSFFHHNFWEDWRNGQFDFNCKDSEDKAQLCIELLSSKRKFRSSIKDVIQYWPFSARHNLSNISMNRKAWLGQASCCFSCNAPDFVTKLAWNTLPLEIRRQANFVAGQAITDWEKKYNPNIGIQLKIWNG